MTLATFVLAAVLAPPFELKPVHPQLTVSLSDQETQTFEFEIVNRSGRPVSIWFTDFWINHTFDLRTTDGTAVNRTEEGVRAISLFGSRCRDHNWPFVLESGKTLQDRSPNLTRIFDLRPGKYELKVTYSDDMFNQLVQIESKKIPVIVTP